MRLLLLYAVALGTLAAQDTHTWGGLTFGMTEVQVRAALGSKLLKPGPSDQPIDKSSHLFTGGLASEGAVVGFTGQATLLFDKTSKKLSAITLFLGPMETSTNEDKSSAYTRLREDLLKKYGSPVEHAGCDGEAAECHLIFRTKSQSVDVLIDVSHGIPLVVHVLYEPTSIRGI